VTRPQAGRREDYAWFTDVSLRWGDIDVFGHVNNARYYEFFDTAVLRFLHCGDLRVGVGAIKLMVAESGCRFLKEILFEDRLEMGLRVERVGTSSIRYGLAAFLNGEPEAAADGHFVHVHVEPQGRRPAPLPDGLRDHLRIAVTSVQRSPIGA
jgi:acyl-CoA thioester hydrolase